jgi:DNA primase
MHMYTNSKVDFKALRAQTAHCFPLVLAHYGLSPVGSGDQLRISCPWHDDEHPSCSLNTEKGVWKCHAGCSEGNLLEFVHRMETKDGAVVSFLAAGRKLASICRIDVPTIAGRQNAPQTRQDGRSTGVDGKTGEPSSHRANAPERPVLAEIGAVPARAGTEAKAEVRNKPLGFVLSVDLDAALPYLEARGVSRETAAEFGLGLCTSGKTIPGRLAIPIHNAMGELVANVGRWVGDDAAIPENEGKYKLPAGFHKNVELFNLHRVKACQTLVVVEGFFGAVRLYGSLRPRIATVALMGSSISNEQIALLRTHCPALRFVTVCLDGDDAGRKASEHVAASLARHWWVRIATLGDGMQPDTALQADLLAALGRKR